MAAEWLDDLRLEPGPPFQTMGTHSLTLDRWLLADDLYETQTAYKRLLIAERRDEVVAAMPDAADACAEVLDVVLGARGLDPAAGAPEQPSGASAADTLIAAAVLVQEDLAVLQRIEGEWILTAGVVCFPSHWSIGDKVGLPVALVHGPVAHYDRELREKVDRFHDRLSVERPVWRRNWFVHPTRELHLPTWGVDMHVPDTIEADGSPMWIRSERQTLRRLPRTDAIVFTVRVQHCPLGDLLERPDLAARMLAAVESWDDSKRGYTSTGGVLDALTAWLRAVA